MGGQIINPKNSEENGTLETEMEFLKYKNKYNIRGVTLHNNKTSEDSIFVVMTLAKIYYSYKEICIPQCKGVGKCLWDC